MFLHALLIVQKPLQCLLFLLDLLRIVLLNELLQVLLLVQIRGFRDLNTRKVVFKSHFLLDEGVARRDCLDLRIAENGLIHVLHGTRRCL